MITFQDPWFMLLLAAPPLFYSIHILRSRAGRSRTGGGDALAFPALDEARAAGAYCLYVTTYAGNKDSMTFCIHLGFVPVASHPDVHGPDDEGNVYLRKIL